MSTPEASQITFTLIGFQHCLIQCTQSQSWKLMYRKRLVGLVGASIRRVSTSHHHVLPPSRLPIQCTMCDWPNRIRSRSERNLLVSSYVHRNFSKLIRYNRSILLSKESSNPEDGKRVGTEPGSQPDGIDSLRIDTVNLSKLSPMLQFYVKMCRDHPGFLVFMQVGDFYEMYFDHAATLADLLDIRLTAKEIGTNGKDTSKLRIPMSGIPVHTLNDKLKRLVTECGVGVVICDQVEHSALSRGKAMVRREVVRVITPGTRFDEALLEADTNSYLASFTIDIQHKDEQQERRIYSWAFSYVDVSTGYFAACSATNADSLESLLNEIIRVRPDECLYDGGSPDASECVDWLSGQFNNYPGLRLRLTKRETEKFKVADASTKVHDAFNLDAPRNSEKLEDILVSSAAGAILRFLLDTLERPRFEKSVTSSSDEDDAGKEEDTLLFPSLRPLKRYSSSNHMWLDPNVIRNLEILETLRDNSKQGSLLWALDRTCTTMGKRKLRNWLMNPLLDASHIIQRQEIVTLFMTSLFSSDQFRKSLRKLSDLERIASRIGSLRGNPRELKRYSESIQVIPSLIKCVEDLLLMYPDSLGKNSSVTDPKMLEFVVAKQFLQLVDELKDLLILADETVDGMVDEPPTYLPPGYFTGEYGSQSSKFVDETIQIFRHGYSKDLDFWNDAIQNQEETMQDLLVKLRGDIPDTVKMIIRKHMLDGWVISMTRASAEKLTVEQASRLNLSGQTKTDVRFKPKELRDMEILLKSACQNSNKMQSELFCDLRKRFQHFTEKARELADLISTLDVLSSFALLAIENDYCRPEFTDSRVVNIEEGRHAVLEQVMRAASTNALGHVTSHRKSFVPNSTTFSPDNSIIVLTGSNGGGKSVYLRQVALIQLMAQIGSFVPAKSARLRICDRIFTRVGAVDDIAANLSTFMVEMSETSSIIHHATRDSLVLLDEVGRGTAVSDGLGIAWAVLEYFSSLRLDSPMVIFSTHYHELNHMADMSRFCNVRNYHAEVSDDGFFTYHILPGGSSNSHGINAARRAGMRKSIVERAEQIRTALESASNNFSTILQTMMTEEEQVNGTGLEPVQSIRKKRVYKKRKASDSNTSEEEVDKEQLGPTTNGIAMPLDLETLMNEAERKGYERGVQETNRVLAEKIKNLGIF